MVLTLGVLAQTANSVFLSAPAFLIPLLHTQRGMSLAEAGTLAAAPTFGMVLTLIAWGALADRIGEKWVISVGLALTALATVGAIVADGYVAMGFFLLLGGMASGSTSAASGRVVVGWFPKPRRGLAMGIRQMSQPLGVTVAAVTVPALAASDGITAALGVPLALTAVMAVACAIGVVDPPRAGAAAAAHRPAPAHVSPPPTGTQTHSPGTRPANPYLRSGFLWRIHAVSALLVVPQFTLSTFGLVWLVTELGWAQLPAGILIGVSQFVGAIGRIGVGVLSDRVGSRVRPLRWVALAAVAVMLVLSVTDAAELTGLAAAALVVATVVTVADNGLAFTSVAEMAGSAWAGRALGAQNTGQFIAASAVGPAVGGLIGVIGYPLAFVVVAVCPAVAVPLIPSSAVEHDRL